MNLRGFFILTIGLVICSFSGYSAEVSIKSGLMPNDEKPIERLMIQGEIKIGDSKKIRELAVKDRVRFFRAASRGILLDSPGGNVDEAIKIAEILRSLAFPVWAFQPYKCLSSCFLIYAAAATRYATTDTVGIHRPYFPQNLTLKIDPREAEILYRQKLSEVKLWLERQNVPVILINEMMQRTSQEIYWLDVDDIRKIGANAPWYEEWLIARCPNFVETEKQFLRDSADPLKKLRFQAEVACAERHESVYRIQAIESLIGR